MDSMLNIYSMKCFARMRNKAQMFSSLADDHYHTRLMHSFEVCDVSLQIVEKLKELYPRSRKLKNISIERIKKISLLHDIGHTPYGHIGERTLHKICSGQIKVDLLPDFNDLNCAIGFKHNINSSLLYKEYLISQAHKITKEDCYIIDGIIKHSKLFYSDEEKYNYGFKNVIEGLEIEIPFNKKEPLTLEGFIVYFADEIAQMFCDYLDLDAGKFDISTFFDLEAFDSSLSNRNEIANKAVKYMIELFANCVDVNKSSINKIKKSTFGIKLEEFDSKRLHILDSNETIKGHDFVKERNVILLFQHYFLHPSEGLGLLDDFIARATSYEISSSIKDELILLKKETFDDYINKTVVNTITSEGYNSTQKYTLILKVFIRSVAVYISKMTDGYADHKTKKIMSRKSID